MTLNKGDKLLRISDFTGLPDRLYTIDKINEKSYTLNNGNLIDKETLITKGGWTKDVYVLATQDMIDDFLKIETLNKKTNIIKDFNNQVREHKEIIMNLLEVLKDDLEIIKHV